ncbi:MAG: aspartate--tRNA(Asn) ligase [Aggregatilineales bacterium]
MTAQTIRDRVLSSNLTAHIGEQVYLCGWLHRLRLMGELNFLILRDRAGLAQAVLTPDELAPLVGLSPETVIALTGTVVKETQAPAGVELHDVTVEVLSPVSEPTTFPLYKKSIRVALPTFLDHAVVGHRALDRRAILRIASGVMTGFRETLRSQDFTEIQTPKLVSTATESGANVFPVEYFGRKAYLAQSPQLYKQIMVGVFERVFEVGPVFRAEPHATSRHITEYVSLDAEFGFIRDHHDVMALLTRVMRGILAYLQIHHLAELRMLDVELPTVPEHIPQIHFPAAQQILHTQFGVKDALGEPDLSPEHERILGEWARSEHGSDFLFVTGYPMVKRAFYTHPDPTDARWSNSFDLLFRGLEITTGGQRLHRYSDYLAAMARAKLPEEAVESYLEAFKFGMPPHGGFAIGLERLVMQLLCLENVKLATLFPRDMGRLTP